MDDLTAALENALRTAPDDELLHAFADWLGTLETDDIAEVCAGVALGWAARLTTVHTPLLDAGRRSSHALLHTMANTSAEKWCASLRTAVRSRPEAFRPGWLAVVVHAVRGAL